MLTFLGTAIIMFFPSIIKTSSFFRTKHHNVYAVLFSFFFWRDLSPQGSNPCPSRWKHGVSTTGLTGRFFFFFWGCGGGGCLFNHKRTVHIRTFIFVHFTVESVLFIWFENLNCRKVKYLSPPSHLSLHLSRKEIAFCKCLGLPCRISVRK